jgi:microcystin degradation protein MlrC
MRVFIAHLSHETNSFSPLPTSLESYRDSMLYRPGRDPWNAAIEGIDGAADFVRLARASGHEVVRGLMASTPPSRPTPRRVYEELRDEILGELESALPLDMVLLSLHGAQVADGYDDCEGDLVERVRTITGPMAAIGVQLDLHFNLSERMVENATIINACKEYPHTDIAAESARLYALVERTAQGALRPVTAFRHVPMLGQFFTTRPAMRAFTDRAKRLEEEGAALSVSIGHGFPWADTPDTAASVLVTTDGDRARAGRLADELAAEFFALRAEVAAPLVPVEAMVGIVRNARHGPVVVADGSDNPGGGAACDSTFVLAALLEAGIRDVAIAWIVDPGAVRIATDAGVGARLPLRIGGKTGPQSGPPVDLEVTVRAVTPGLTQPGLGCDLDTELGAAALVEADGIHVVLVSRRNQPFGPDPLRELGLDPRALRAIVLKSSQHFYVRFSELAAEVVYVDAPGAISQRFASLPYRRLRRPLWPLDEPPFHAFGRDWPAGRAR